MKKIPYGLTDYKYLIENDYYYVDKTGFIPTLEKTPDPWIYLRPRRFGKTLFTSMLFYYYDVNSEILFDTLFKNTEIYNNPTKSKNNYYVLRFDFSGIDSNDIKKIESSFVNKVNNALIRFNNYYKLGLDLRLDSTASGSLDSFITDFEGLCLDHNIYIIIDEYDKFNTILEGNADLFESILGEGGFVRTFYEVIKTAKGSCVHKVFITGVCSVSLDSMTSGFNIATNISADSEFNAMTGLSKKEVEALIKDMPKETYDIMESNYDGYSFYEPLSEDKELKHVFNSNSIMYYVSNYLRLNRPPKELMDTNIISSYEQIRNIVTIKNNPYYKEVLSEIFENRKISGKLKSNFDLSMPITRDDIISMLYYFGYLTISGYNEIDEELILKIPNKGIDKIYNQYYLAILKEYNINLEKDMIKEEVREIISEGKITLFSNLISESIKKASNDIYIGFNERSLQIMYYSALSQYQSFKTEFEYSVGDKKVDIMLISNSDNVPYNMMLEFKYVKKSKKIGDKLVKKSAREIEKEIEEKKQDGIKQLKEYGDIIDIDKSKLRKYVILFVGSSLEVLEEVI